MRNCDEVCFMVGDVGVVHEQFGSLIIILEFVSEYVIVYICTYFFTVFYEFCEIL